MSSISATRPLCRRPASRRALLGLLIVWTVAALGLASLANAELRPHGHAHAHDSVPYAALPIMEAISVDDTDEIESHGHRHSGNHLRDLLTLGHVHAGCSCAAGLAMSVFVAWLIPYGDAAVPLGTLPSAFDEPTANPFRPPIA